MKSNPAGPEITLRGTFFRYDVNDRIETITDPAVRETSLGPSGDNNLTSR